MFCRFSILVCRDVYKVISRYDFTMFDVVDEYFDDKTYKYCLKVLLVYMYIKYSEYF